MNTCMLLNMRGKNIETPIFLHANRVSKIFSLFLALSILISQFSSNLFNISFLIFLLHTICCKIKWKKKKKNIHFYTLILQVTHSLTHSSYSKYVVWRDQRHLLAHIQAIHMISSSLGFFLFVSHLFVHFLLINLTFSHMDE
jgi:hypothetical protein